MKESSPDYDLWIKEGLKFLPEPLSLHRQLLGAAAELIGHDRLVTESEWDYYVQARRVACPWLLKKKSITDDWSPFREAEALFDSRGLVQEVLGGKYPLEMVFGIAAVAAIGEAGFNYRAYSGEPPQPPDFMPAGQLEAFHGIAEASALVSLGRRLRGLPADPGTKVDLDEARRVLNRSAAEKRNEKFRHLHAEFARYLACNKVKSIRNAAKVFYEALPTELQHYNSVENAVRSLSAPYYGQKK